MNWQHLKAFCWLRWRLSANQWRRGGALNALLMTIVAISTLVMAVPLFFGSFVLGLFVFPKATPVQLMYGWDAVVVGFVFFWSIGVLAELQRTESLSLSKFMHLPVSVKGAFLINYASSLVRLSTIVFVPILLGLGLALPFSQGVSMLAVLPATLGFLLMVSAVTYQFQGWLAALMSNPRRRRTVVMIVTMAFVLVFQLPNLIRFVGPWSGERNAEHATKLLEEQQELNRAIQSKQIDQAEWLRRQEQAAEKNRLAREQANREVAAQVQETATLLNLVLPIGWLPLGVLRAAEGNALPAILGTLGMTLVGAGCLWRAYRTTVGLYQGRDTGRRRPAEAAAPTSIQKGKPTAGLLDKRLAGFSEPVSAVALASFQSLIRAPESRMMLITPLILSAIFGTMALRSAGTLSDPLRALVGIGAIAMTLFGAMQLMANQFGFDRDGFRTYVLCAASRRDILLGKNLAFAPLLGGLVVILLVILQFIAPMRWDHLLAMAPQFVSMYLLLCISMNLLSIYAPMRIASGSLNPAKPMLLPVLLQLAMLFFLVPMTQGPVLLPLGIEAASEFLGWTARVPICLLLTVAECVGVVFLYRFVLNWQGDLLRSREQKILDVVTNR